MYGVESFTKTESWNFSTVWRVDFPCKNAPIASPTT